MRIEFIRDYICYQKGQSFDIDQYGMNILVGDNGAGKTTLIDLLRAKSFKRKKDRYFTATGVKKQKTKILHSEGFRVPRSQLIDNREDVYRIGLNHKSHGEAWKAQVKALTDQFSDDMFLIMDEPETALSIESQVEIAQTLLDFMHDYKNVGFLIATHSIIIMEILQGTLLRVPMLDRIDTKEYLEKRYELIESVKLRKKQYDGLATQEEKPFISDSTLD